MKRSEIERGFPGVRLGDEFDEEGWWKCRPWEDYDAAQTRAERVARKIHDEFGHTGECVVLVSHGAFMRFLVGVILDTPGMGHDRIDWFANTSVTRFIITPTYTHLALMNCVRHLPESWITGRTSTRSGRASSSKRPAKGGVAPGRSRTRYWPPTTTTSTAFPLSRDEDFFERLVLEINQAGLSWLTVLKKRKALRDAFEGFDVDRVAAYGDEDRTRLLADAGIIRNRLKIDAAIHNARVIREIRAEHGSFAAWLNGQTCVSLDEWVAVFKKTFRFMGPEIVGEFLMSTGYLPIHHDPECFLAGEGHRVG